MRFRNIKFALLAFALFSWAWLAHSEIPLGQVGDVSRWETFTNRAGWAIKYPPKAQVGSCNNCLDPTDPNVFVTFHDPSTSEIVMKIEHLSDKPSSQDIEKWLNDVKQKTVLRPVANEEWIFLDGLPALKVRYAGEFEWIYTVKGSKTFSIGGPTDVRSIPLYRLYQQMLSTLRFTSR